MRKRERENSRNLQLKKELNELKSKWGDKRETNFLELCLYDDDGGNIAVKKIKNIYI